MTRRIDVIDLDGMVFRSTARRGWIFSEIKGWDGLTDNKEPLEEFDDHHGAAPRERALRSSRAISMKVAFLGQSARDAAIARDRFNALGAAGPITMMVPGPGGPMHRVVTVEHSDIPDSHGRDVLDGGAIDMLAEDPLKYGTLQTASTGLATSGTGIRYPIRYPIDYGVRGNRGRLTLTNLGTATSYARFTARGGFETARITEVGSGRRLEVDRPIDTASSVTWDSELEEVLVNGELSVPSLFLPHREWWAVPPRSDMTVQFTATGVVGEPVLEAELRSAWW